MNDYWPLTGYLEVTVQTPLGLAHSFMEIDPEIFSEIILSLQ